MTPQEKQNIARIADADLGEYQLRQQALALFPELNEDASTTSPKTPIRRPLEPNLTTTPPGERHIPEWFLSRKSKLETRGATTWNPKRILPKEKVAKIRQLYQQNPDIWTYQKIAATYEISYEAARRIVKAKIFTGVKKKSDFYDECD